ncbi:hypothetical protein [Streptomyces tauricus]
MTSLCATECQCLRAPGDYEVVGGTEVGGDALAGSSADAMSSVAAIPWYRRVLVTAAPVTLTCSTNAGDGAGVADEGLTVEIDG